MRRSPVAAALAVTAVLTGGTLALGSATHQPAVEHAARACPAAPFPVAHRFGSERYIENTDAAARNAANIGVTFGETDVRFTSDDEPVIMHDATVDRTTDGTGAVADLTAAQIAGLRTAGNLRVPTLADLMLGQSVDRAYLFVELKVTPTAAQWKAFADALTSRAGAGTPKPVISSFDPAVLDQVPLVEDGALSGYTRALIRSVGDFDPATVTPHATIVLVHHDAITATRLTKWTAAGLKIYAWADPAADPVSEWERMADFAGDAAAGSVTGYVTSSPGAYRTWAAGRTC